MPRCLYCPGSGPFTDEHVLSRAFSGGGEDWVLQNTVCNDCNQLFRTYERAWTSSPGEAIARIAYGPAGRNRNGLAYQAHPSEHIFLQADGDPIFYEVDVLRGMVPRFRPQAILTSSGIVPRASSGTDLPRLNKALNAFLKNPEITIQKRPFPGNDRFRIATFTRENAFEVRSVEMRIKPAEAWFDRFPTGLEMSRDPRISVDASNRLRIRAHNLKQACHFLSTLTTYGQASTAGGTHAAGTYQIAVLAKHDGPKIERAIAKTAINFAAATQGREWIENGDFGDVLSYCRDIRQPGTFVRVRQNETGIPAIDEAVVEAHALALKSDGRNAFGYVRLYGGSVHEVALGRAPVGSPAFVSSIWIDFNGKGRIPPLQAPPVIDLGAAAAS